VRLGCDLDDRRIGVRRPVRGERVSSFPDVKTGSAALPASYAIRIEVQGAYKLSEEFAKPYFHKY